MVFHYNTFLAHVDDNNYGGSSGGQLRVSQQPSKLLCPASPQVHPNSSLENHLILIILDQNKKIVSAPSKSTSHCSLEESPHPKSSKKFLCNNTTSSPAQHLAAQRPGASAMTWWKTTLATTTMDFLHNMKTATCPSATANIWVWNFFGGCYQIIEQPISSNISGAIIPFKNFGIINTFLSDLYDVSSIWYSAIGVSLVLILALVSSCIFPSKVCLLNFDVKFSQIMKTQKVRHAAGHYSRIFLCQSEIMSTDVFAL